jgi:hypothetical protein
MVHDPKFKSDVQYTNRADPAHESNRRGPMASPPSQDPSFDQDPSNVANTALISWRDPTNSTGDEIWR